MALSRRLLAAGLVLLALQSGQAQAARARRERAERFEDEERPSRAELRRQKAEAKARKKALIAGTTAELNGRFYLGGGLGTLISDSPDAKQWFGTRGTYANTYGFSYAGWLGYQSSWGGALGLGYRSTVRQASMDYGTATGKLTLVLQQDAFFVEPRYLALVGRRFAMGTGLAVGFLTNNLVTLTDSTDPAFKAEGSSHGHYFKPNVSAHLIFARLLSLDLTVGYAFDFSDQVQSDGSPVYYYTSSGARQDWRMDNSGITADLGLTLYLGRIVSLRPPKEAGDLLPIDLSSAERLAEAESWTLKVLDEEGQVVHQRQGEGPLPKELRWRGVDELGRKLDLEGMRVRLDIADRFGGRSSSEAPYGQPLEPRGLQLAMPLLAGRDDGQGGLLIHTQFRRDLPGMKEWTVQVKDAKGVVLKEFTGRDALPRTLSWDLRDRLGGRVEPKGLRFEVLTRDPSGPAFASQGGLAASVKPKELLASAPRFDPAAERLVFKPRDLGVEGIRLKAWTLSLKAADGVLLKVVQGSGPLPKELSFSPSELQAPGVDLRTLKSGAAFVQYSLATVDEKGVERSASDALALDQGHSGGADLADGDFKPQAGRELLLLVKPALLSPDPAQARRGALLLRAPEDARPGPWALELRSPSGRLLKSFQGKGALPATLAWDGRDRSGQAVEDPGSVKAELVLDGRGAGQAGQPLLRSFQYEGGGAVLRRVHAAWFAQGEAEIQAEMLGRLDRVAAWLASQPGAEVVIQGHCSKEGDPRFNEALARQRAQTVKDWLSREKGLDPERLHIQSYGTKLLLDEGEGEDAVRRNRRIDVVLVRWPGQKEAQDE